MILCVEKTCERPFFRFGQDRIAEEKNTIAEARIKTDTLYE
ncbi:MAG: hypothetical protein WAK17_12605 [Candidatus Nitrosopolaris sp.]|jgi:hypothetical protein